MVRHPGDMDDSRAELMTIVQTQTGSLVTEHEVRSRGLWYHDIEIHPSLRTRFPSATVAPGEERR